MLVSHRKKFIFTKTVKTAGTSVESYFEPYCMPLGDWRFAHHRDQYVSETGIIGYRGPEGVGRKEWYNHMSAQDIRSRVGHSTWNRYLKFCTIRNPFDLLVSWFYFHQKQLQVKGMDSREVVDRFRKTLANGIPVMGRQQYLIDGEICLDDFIRFERLKSDTARICKLLNLPFEPNLIPELKKGIRDTTISLSRFYTPELVRQVEGAYALEISEFGYQFED